jgi:hypothetical protein
VEWDGIGAESWEDDSEAKRGGMADSGSCILSHRCVEVRFLLGSAVAQDLVMGKKVGKDMEGEAKVVRRTHIETTVDCPYRKENILNKSDWQNPEAAAINDNCIKRIQSKKSCNWKRTDSITDFAVALRNVEFEHLWKQDPTEWIKSRSANFCTALTLATLRGIFLLLN